MVTSSLEHINTASWPEKLKALREKLEETTNINGFCKISEPSTLAFSSSIIPSQPFGVDDFPRTHGIWLAGWWVIPSTCRSQGALCRCIFRYFFRIFFSPFAQKDGGEIMKKRIPDRQWKSTGCFGDIGDDITHLYGLHWAIIRIPISQPGLMECNKVGFWVSNEGDEKTSKPPFFKKPDIFRLFMKELLLDLIGYVKSHQNCNAHFRWLNDLYNYIRWYHLGLVFWMCFEAVKSFACIEQKVPTSRSTICNCSDAWKVKRRSLFLTLVIVYEIGTKGRRTVHNGFFQVNSIPTQAR